MRGSGLDSSSKGDLFFVLCALCFLLFELQINPDNPVILSTFSNHSRQNRRIDVTS